MTNVTFRGYEWLQMKILRCEGTDELFREPISEWWEIQFPVTLLDEEEEIWISIPVTLALCCLQQVL